MMSKQKLGWCGRFKLKLPRPARKPAAPKRVGVIRGLSRRIVLVRPKDPEIFEEAIFVVRDDGGIAEEDLLDEARYTAESFIREHTGEGRRDAWFRRPLVCAAAGAAVMGLICLCAHMML